MKGVKHLVSLANQGCAHAYWYIRAEVVLRQMAEQKGWNYQRFINVLAITSPRVQVAVNLRLTQGYMRNGSTLGMIRSTRVALAHYEEAGEIRGRKTEAFARALRGDTTAIVLDTWMAKALDVDPLKVTTKRNMAKAKRRIERVALLLGCHPREAQAMIWAGAILAAGLAVPTLEG